MTSPAASTGNAMTVMSLDVCTPSDIRGPVVVLLSRSHSFIERLPQVMEYAITHNITNVILLHCPESHYTADFVAHITALAHDTYASSGKHMAHAANGIPAVFLFVERGKLEENLERVLHAFEVRLVFVGVKMLDHRPEVIKKLAVPFFFMSEFHWGRWVKKQTNNVPPAARTLQADDESVSADAFASLRT